MDEMLQQILAELKSLKSDVAGIKDGQERLEKDVAWLKTDVNGLKEGQERLEKDVTRLKTDITGLKDGQERLEKDVAWLKTDVAGLKEDQDRLETKMDNLALELRNSYKYTKEKMEEHRNVLENTARELKIAKIDIDYLSSKTEIHDTKINRILSNIKA
ncbi:MULTISPECIES: hypothetical protein [Heyndrickxia]|uniref:hypothetical protein n=1 Tax=Heyndrickxia TaxID=2837504 RepID=UPI00042674D2|nr:MULTISPECIES: hypothetical protein [Heyndrickxia]